MTKEVKEGIPLIPLAVGAARLAAPRVAQWVGASNPSAALGAAITGTAATGKKLYKKAKKVYKNRKVSGIRSEDIGGATGVGDIPDPAQTVQGPRNRGPFDKRNKRPVLLKRFREFIKSGNSNL